MAATSERRLYVWQPVTQDTQEVQNFKLSAGDKFIPTGLSPFRPRPNELGGAPPPARAVGGAPVRPPIQRPPIAAATAPRETAPATAPAPRHPLDYEANEEPMHVDNPRLNRILANVQRQHAEALEAAAQRHAAQVRELEDQIPQRDIDMDELEAREQALAQQILDNQELAAVLGRERDAVAEQARLYAEYPVTREVVRRLEDTVQNYEREIQTLTTTRQRLEASLAATLPRMGRLELEAAEATTRQRLSDEALARSRHAIETAEARTARLERVWAERERELRDEAQMAAGRADRLEDLLEVEGRELAAAERRLEQARADFAAFGAQESPQVAELRERLAQRELELNDELQHALSRGDRLEQLMEAAGREADAEEQTSERLRAELLAAETRRTLERMEDHTHELMQARLDGEAQLNAHLAFENANLRAQLREGAPERQTSATQTEFVRRPARVHRGIQAVVPVEQQATQAVPEQVHQANQYESEAPPGPTNEAKAEALEAYSDAYKKLANATSSREAGRASDELELAQQQLAAVVGHEVGTEEEPVSTAAQKQRAQLLRQVNEMRRMVDDAGTQFDGDQLHARLKRTIPKQQLTYQERQAWDQVARNLVKGDIAGSRDALVRLQGKIKESEKRPMHRGLLTPPATSADATLPPPPEAVAPTELARAPDTEQTTLEPVEPVVPPPTESPPAVAAPRPRRKRPSPILPDEEQPEATASPAVGTAPVVEVQADHGTAQPIVVSGGVAHINTTPAAPANEATPPSKRRSLEPVLPASEPAARPPRRIPLAPARPPRVEEPLRSAETANDRTRRLNRSDPATLNGPDFEAWQRQQKLSFDQMVRYMKNDHDIAAFLAAEPSLRTWLTNYAPRHLREPLVEAIAESYHIEEPEPEGASPRSVVSESPEERVMSMEQDFIDRRAANAEEEDDEDL